VLSPLVEDGSEAGESKYLDGFTFDDESYIDLSGSD
jgi:hypothetical protein